jgi:hypothetical protein
LEAKYTPEDQLKRVIKAIVKNRGTKTTAIAFFLWMNLVIFWVLELFGSDLIIPCF